MTMDACYAGNAFLDLFKATGDSMYHERAIKIADTLRKIQNEDGSFPIKVDFATGEPVNEVKAMLHPVLRYSRRLEKEFGLTAYLDMQAKAEQWMREVARDLIRLSEDQFVHWDSLPNEYGIRTIGTPSVFEQYKYQTPVDNSSCNVTNAYLDLYEVTGDRLAYAKAKALINNLTIIQEITNGKIPTTCGLYSPKKNLTRSFWINCSNASIKTLLRMSELVGEE